MNIFLSRVLCSSALLALLITTPVARAAGIISLDLCHDWMLATFASREQVTALSTIHRHYAADKQMQDALAAFSVHDGSIEHLVQQQPRELWVGQYNAVVLRERLKELGFSVRVFDHPMTLADVVTYQKAVLSALSLPHERAVPLPPKAPLREQHRRLLLLGANGIGTGRNTFEHELIEHAGFENYLATDGYQTMDIEQLVVDPPDWILFSAPTSPALANQFVQHAALETILTRGQLVHSDTWRWMCPGPWTIDLINELTQLGRNDDAL
jgi:iron complex transport system substrate-binding protein